MPSNKSTLRPKFLLLRLRLCNLIQQVDIEWVEGTEVKIQTSSDSWNSAAVSKILGTKIYRLFLVLKAISKSSQHRNKLRKN